MRQPPLLLLLATVACGPSQHRQAQLADTPEAYESYLAAEPQAEDREFLLERIDELRWLEAKERRDSEGFRAYLSHHPEGRHATDAQHHEEESAWQEARGAGAVGDFERFIQRFPSGDHVPAAKEAIVARAYIEHLSVTRSALDGRDGRYGVAASVVNRGASPIVAIEVELRLLGEGGGELLAARVWLVGGADAPDLPVAIPAGGETAFRWLPDVPPTEVASTVDVRIRAVRLGRSEEEGDAP